MPLALEEVYLDRLADRPLYKQLADHIRDAITSGLLAAGERLPGETELGRAAGVSRYAVRDALDILVGEGLIVKSPGQPARVAHPPRAVHVATSRYRRQRALLRKLDETGEDHPLTSAFVEDFGLEWKSYTVQTDYREERADEVDAHHLGVEVGTMVLRRRLIKRDKDEPLQLQTSVMPLDLVKDTPVADPNRQPWPGGTMNELHSLHKDVTRVSETVRGRLPTDQERRDLRMETPGPVQQIVRVFATGKGRARLPVECSIVVVEAAKIVLEFETDLD